MKSWLRKSVLVCVGVSLLAFTPAALRPAAKLSAPAGSAPQSAGQLLNLQSTRATEGPEGVTPSQIYKWYDVNEAMEDGNGNLVDGTGQTIAIVDPGSDPYVGSELHAFIKYWQLPPMLGLGTTSCSPSGYGQEPCFETVKSGVVTGTPSKEEYEEMALDIEWAHAAAPGANIILVEAPLEFTVQEADAAIQLAAGLAPIVSMSWDQPEMTAADAASWDQMSAAFVSGEGDLGYPETHYPAADPNVLSVGGTDIVSHPGQEWAWTDTGGGLTDNARPGYQVGWTTSTDREVNDVSFNAVDYPIEMAAPRYGLDWYEVDGVSAGIPIWAGIIALANQLRRTVNNQLDLENQGVMDALYLAAGHNESSGKINPAYFRDITQGCAYASAAKPKPPCVKDARAGYDPLTGLGSPNVADLVNYLGYDLQGAARLP
jgi:subtilase family serine protease